MNVIDAAYNVVHEYPGGSESLVTRMSGKSATTLSHEVAKIGTAKFGLETAVAVSMLTRDMRILEAFAATCGRMTLPLPELLATVGDDCLSRLGDVLRESGQLVAEVSGGLSDGNINDNEARRIEHECGQLIAAATSMMAAVRARNLAGKAGRTGGGA